MKEVKDPDRYNEEAQDRRMRVVMQMMQKTDEILGSEYERHEELKERERKQRELEEAKLEEVG